MVDDCEISEFPPSPHLTWPRTWRRRAPPGTPRLFCCSTTSCLTSPSSYQFCNHSVLDLIQTEAHTQTNRTGGCWWWGGTLATCVWFPVTPPPATPHRLCHYLPDKLLGNRTLLDIFTSSSCRNTIFIFPKTSYHKDRIPSILLTSITWQRIGWSKYHLK